MAHRFGFEGVEVLRCEMKDERGSGLRGGWAVERRWRKVFHVGESWSRRVTSTENRPIKEG